MSFSGTVLDAIARLASYYNGDNYNPSTNPGGMRNGGHRLNFAPALQDQALVADAVAAEAIAASASASAASSSAGAASGSASAASASASAAEAAKVGAESAQAAAEAAAAGITWKVTVKVASTANLTLSGTQVVDGVSLVVNDRVLVKDQTTSANNGIYIVQTGAWIRSADANTWSELVGAAVIAEQGTINSDIIFICTSNSGGTLGTTAVTFARISLASLVGEVSGAQITDNSISSIKLIDGIISYAKVAGAALASTADILSGTASKIATAAGLRPLFDVCELGRSAAQSIALATTAIITFDTEVKDTGGWHDNVTNNSRITVDFNGSLEVVASAYGTGSNGYMNISIRKNGNDTGFLATGAVGASSTIGACVSGIISVASGDYIDISVRNNTGGGAINFYPVVSARRVR